ncbi:hypothetical protein D0869_00013 [Hortaea werneckii]|uniref:Transcription factor Iwr1 domain-containing protein n=2 Tax=Hortaea werneckii TaxID=91943 RepID=A0A3M7A3M2_HORWE|nr:hypothetical protein D0869_00013 [Hortaea werneckii]RMY09316.1 hypothetical protein D0868_04320 [Hortaea werneckii]RMY22135.1 hypothetical protein D0867_02916 [Hortaea werneckii]
MHFWRKMQGPNEVRLKRKRNEQAPETLIVEPQHKRTFTDAAQNLRYRRQEVQDQREVAATEAFSGESVAKRQSAIQQDPPPTGGSRPSSKSGRRVFHLTQPAGIRKPTRSSRDQDVATFMEQRPVKRAARPSAIKTGHASGSTASPSQPLKRPGTTAVPQPVRPTRNSVTSGDARQQKHLESLANDLHQFALDEMAASQKPKVTAVPKLSAARSREIHRQRTSASEASGIDHEMTANDDGEYVYDTYILAPDGKDAGGSLDAELGDVGYLIITEEDEALWEAYMEEMQNDKDFDTDDEDENAEGYYAADYPEDDLASDDEFDRNAYGYRRHGDSDNEEWDEDTGAYHSDDEQEFAKHPWKARTPKPVDKYFGQDDSD